MAGTYEVSGVSVQLSSVLVAHLLILAKTGPIDWAPTDSSQATSTFHTTNIQLAVQKSRKDTCDRSSTEDVEGKVVPLAV